MFSSGMDNRLELLGFNGRGGIVMNWVKPGKAFVAPNWYFIYDLTSKGAVQKFCHRSRPTDDTR